MEKLSQQNKETETTGEIASKSDVKINTIERLVEKALREESYEDAEEALNKVESLRDFRKKLQKLPFGAFHEIVEEITNLNGLPLSSEERIKENEILIEKLVEKAAMFSPRVADLYLGILAELKGEAYEPKFTDKPDTRKKIAELKKIGKDGWSDLDILFSPISPKVSWNDKLNRIISSFDDGKYGYLSGIRDLDKREGRTMDDNIRKWREEELKKMPTNPPQRKNESKPGVDPMDRLKQGERAPSVWSITPPWGGYYKEQSFSKWDSVRNVWIEEEYTYTDAEIVPLSGNNDYKKGPTDITLSGKIFSGSWISLPVPYTHGLHRIEASGQNYKVKQDQNGDLVILAEGTGEIEIKVMLAPHLNKKFKSDPKKARVAEMPAEFSHETNNKLEEIKNSKRGNIARANAIASYVISRIKYLAPKDKAEADYYNNIYYSSPKGFAGAVDEIKKGDCDTVNTYFAALCSKLNIPVRHIIGHSVKGKDEQGNSNINSGTGHGWSEVWDEVKKEWIRFDATPPGDPNLEEEEKTEGGEAPGDYGARKAVRPTDEQIEELRKKLAEHKEKLSYTTEERRLAEEAGIELKEARQIQNEIKEAELTCLPNGELVIDALSKLFNAIIATRKSIAEGYTGPVRESEGGEEIEDIVLHLIQLKGGEMDPSSRRLPDKEIKQEKILGGFDLYIIGDKSGSMSSTSEEGEVLWQMQRRAIYLILSSLYNFEKKLKFANIQKQNALSVRSQSVSFRGNEEGQIDLDKPISSDFNSKDKVKLWNSLTGQGMENGDPEALSIIYEQIKKEVEDMKKRGIKDNRLRLVIACSDGGYTGSDGAKMQMLSKMLHELNANVITVGLGLTESAVNVPVVMENPPLSRGEIVPNINKLPLVVAKYVILEAIKLFPEKGREGAKQIINNLIKKFENRLVLK